MDRNSVLQKPFVTYTEAGELYRRRRFRIFGLRFGKRVKLPDTLRVTVSLYEITYTLTRPRVQYAGLWEDGFTKSSSAPVEYRFPLLKLVLGGIKMMAEPIAHTRRTYIHPRTGEEFHIVTCSAYRAYKLPYLLSKTRKYIGDHFYIVSDRFQISLLDRPLYLPDAKNDAEVVDAFINEVADLTKMS